MRKMTIYIDTREQKPYEFKGCKQVRRGLKVGDYSVQDGLGRGGIIIERKSPEDMIGTLTKKTNLERFKKELDKMAKFKYKIVVIETSPKGLISACAASRTTANGEKVLELLLELSLQYGFWPVFAGSRSGGQMFTQKILTKWWCGRLRY